MNWACLEVKSTQCTNATLIHGTWDHVGRDRCGEIISTDASPQGNEWNATREITTQCKVIEDRSHLNYEWSYDVWNTDTNNMISLKIVYWQKLI